MLFSGVSMSRIPRVAIAAAFVAFAARAIAAPSAQIVADRLYLHGVVFTADAEHPAGEAVAIRDGRIVYVGSDAGAAGYRGPATQTIDLGGKFVMPGIIDGHMHPLQAGTVMLKCNLDYAALTVVQLQQRVQACLDEAPANDDTWLEVVNWFQESMLPPGVKTSHATLDVLRTKRPIIVRSSFGHSVLANSRAMALANITAKTPDPVGGKIQRDANGNPTGVLEDSAFVVFETLIPKPTAADDIVAANAALDAMSAQGITSFLDAIAPPGDLAAFSAVHAAGRLKARAHFAVPITPPEAADPGAAVAKVVGFAKQYDAGAIGAAPSITVRNAKLFLDGVIAAPALTGAMREPYRTNTGTAEHPVWAPGSSRGPAVYFPPAQLAALLIGLGRAGIDPHLHADGDGAGHAGLDGVAALRKALPGADIRVAIAHDEIVDPIDYPRFRALDAIAVLSLQWGKPAGDTLGLVDYFGPQRMARLEPAGVLAAAGARIAFGSDWPVDRLDEWFAFKVGVTRTNAPDAPAAYRGRLGDDPGLSREAVLTAATINAAYELHQDDVTGSIEIGKFADLIVLDRNPLTVPAEDIANVRVLETVVGGVTVYAARPQEP
jgi:predicted amidohydrolase YtcJ